MLLNNLVKCLQNRRFFFRKYSARETITYSSNLDFINQSITSPIPTYTLLNTPHSTRIQDLKVDIDLVIKMYSTMVSLHVMDSILYEAQRQGRISFYMTSFGEEAVQVGSAAALCIEDLVYSQYRESGILLWRGFHLIEFINQCYGNELDKNRGRQMPVHYGSKKYNFMTISSPLCTQLPQAVGAAYGIKKMRRKSCIACYFGEGAASEGDAHAAFNFAATLKCPVIFICRNNGYAISTPKNQQYNGDGIAAKGVAYGIQTIRVDGNDIFAMYRATKFARNYAVEQEKPVLIEAITYRIGHHSTSDDSGIYRTNEEVKEHLKITPIIRLKNYLQNINSWNEDKEKDLVCRTKTLVMEAITVAERQRKPCWKELFSDVYSRKPVHIRKQIQIMENHLIKYSRQYLPFLKHTDE